MSVPGPRASGGSNRREATATRLAAGLPAVWRRDGIRVGVDVVEVRDVTASLGAHGDRYLGRVFTPHELASCRRVGGDYAPEALAARFAAKEAVVKVLRPRGARPEWRNIEVRRDTGGWCEIRLAGRAGDLADEAGIRDLAVSLSHEPDVAAAVAVARCDDGDGVRE